MSLWKLMTGRWGTGAGEVDDVRIDASTNTLQSIEYEHHEIHSGSHYFVCSYVDLTAGQVLDFTWLMPDSAVWTHWVWDIDSEAEFNWLVYEGATATNPLDNTITPRNNNRNSNNTSGTTMKYEIQANLAAANADTDVTSATLLESGITGSGKKLTGSTNRASELVLDQASLYCLRGIATEAGYVNFCMQWYEHTDKH